MLHPRASKDDKALTVQGEGERAEPTTVPARIRQIITQSLAEPSSSQGAVWDFGRDIEQRHPEGGVFKARTNAGN